jgi:hypothetical protein
MRASQAPAIEYSLSRGQSRLGSSAGGKWRGDVWLVVTGYDDMSTAYEARDEVHLRATS